MDIHNLNASLFCESNSNVLNQFLHSCADEICGYSGPTYQKFANNMNWTEDDYNYAYKLFSTIFSNPSSLYLDAGKMPQEYYDLPEQVQNKVINCLTIRQEQLATALMMEYSKKHAPTMTEFDWRLKLTMGSSKMASLRESLLQLDLMVNEGKTEKIVSLEMNREELDSLINALESIN